MYLQFIKTISVFNKQNQKALIYSDVITYLIKTQIKHINIKLYLLNLK